ncbi:MAG TPA: hypothetical protein VEV81_14955, partial [Pyrinomonadaceae bacterium]|nr:hypothetical protein [Pyrinomonadaceae bacterium]
MSRFMMYKESYNDRVINEYLLGSLPAAEIEALDELSFTDDEFADALKVAEKDLVDAYVQGELRGAQLEQFESHYLASPSRLEKVRFAEAFQVFAEPGMVAREAAAGEPEKSVESRQRLKKPGWFSASGIFKSPRLALQWGTALVALLALMVGGWLAIENARLQRQVSEGQARREALDQREAELQKELEEQRSLNSKTEEELRSVREERARLEQTLKQQEEERATIHPPGGNLIASFILAPQMRDAGQSRTVTIPAETRFVAMQLNL